MHVNECLTTTAAVVVALLLLISMAVLGASVGDWFQMQLKHLLQVSQHTITPMLACTSIPTPVTPSPHVSVRILMMTLATGKRAGDTPQSSIISNAAEGGVFFPAVDGFNRKETVLHLARAGLRFHRLCGSAKLWRWGTLANFITRFSAFKDQQCRAVPFQATIEDDLSLGKGFREHLRTLAAKHLSGPGLTHHVQLGKFGEGYLTSLRGVDDLLRRFQAAGIRGCPDQQLGDPRIMNLTLVRASHAPWTSMRLANNGQIGRTARISPAEALALRCATASSGASGSAVSAHAVLDRFELLVACNVSSTSCACAPKPGSGE